ncbi:WAT1-related protein At5g64700-like [Benincasa hispida]|uniref:WAT1-related protein At5g64700-like n=1 Tax=Benincasa hispida TaxID=102211 RepID=UPI0019007DB3|nr:WAT1-related protein At5g64700-like [Benincasa hispida]
MGSKKPYFLAVSTQIFLAGMSLLSKAAFASGMNTFVFVFYRQAAGAVFFLPLMFFLKRKESRSLSLKDFLKIFAISLIGMTIGFNAYGVAVDYTSANLGAAAFNCLPVTTFLFAVLLRMEKVKLRTVAGMAKAFGILVCIGGVITLAFYKGPYLKPLINHHLLNFHKSHAHQPHSHSSRTWIIGCFLLFISSISWGLWFVLQAHFLKTYPSPLEFISYQTLLSAAQSFVIAIAMERDPSEWKLGWNIRLLAVIYCGVLVTVVSNFLQCWVIKEKGPVFQAMTTPLNVIATIIGSELLLGEGINLGSLIGAILLVVSLYSVLWGKSKELNMIDNRNSNNNHSDVFVSPELPKDLSEMRPTAEP